MPRRALHTKAMPAFRLARAARRLGLALAVALVAAGCAAPVPEESDALPDDANQDRDLDGIPDSDPIGPEANETPQDDEPTMLTPDAFNESR